jgi:hypothetical protein
MITNNDFQKTYQILNFMKLALSQIYFTFLDKISKKYICIAIWSPISNTTNEIFLQYFEDKHIRHLLDTKT